MLSPASGKSDKRTAPEPAGDHQRSTKRRSSRACLSCRSRKVRCDVVSGGTPCNNCRLDGLDCQLRQSNRGRKPNSAAAESHSISTSGPTVALAELSQSPQALSSDQAQQLPVSLTFESVMLNGRDGSNASVCSAAEPPSPNNTDRTAAFTVQASTQSPRYQLPLFIAPLAPRIQPEDMEYLARKDALTIPDTELRNELLRAYVQVVYPFAPAIDLADFLTPIICPGSSGQVSLLLFQAVMFVSVTYVDVDLLKQRGFLNRQSARKAFFNRVRLLHGVECEADRLKTLQALLLMTYWYDGPDDEKDTWYWTGVSLTLAHVLGLHRDPQPLGFSLQIKRLRKRIWWSCFMRDRLLALGIRRPARIRADEYNVPVLDADDYQLEPLSEHILAFLGPSSWTHDAQTRDTLAASCIELVKLCVIMGHVLHSQYSVVGNHPIGAEYFTSLMMFPIKSDEQMKEKAKCANELDEWHRNLDISCHYKPAPCSRRSEASEHTAIRHFCQASLRMIYLTTIGALHRPQAFQADSTPIERDSANSPSCLSRKKAVDAAVGITELVYDLQSQNLMRWISTTSIPAITFAILIHIADSQSPQGDVRNIGIGRFYQCMQALEQLGEMYASAEYAMAFLEMVIRSMDIKIPMLFFGKSTATKSCSTDTGVLSSRNRFDMTRFQTSSDLANRSQYQNAISGTNVSSNGQNQPDTQQITPLTPGSIHQSGDALLLDADNQMQGNNSNWGEVDGLLSAMMTFDPTRDFFPRAAENEQNWYTFM